MFCLHEKCSREKAACTHATHHPYFLSLRTCAPGQAFGEDSDDSSSSSEEEDGSSSSDSDDTGVGNPTIGSDAHASKEDPAQSNSNVGAAARLTSTSTPAGKINHGTAASTAAAAKSQQGDDDEYLDSVISELARNAAAEEAAGVGTGAEDLQTGASSPLALLLRCDPRCLKLDQELRRKFGGGDRENGAAAAGGGARGGGGRARRTRRGMMVARGGNNSVSASLTLKRLVVSAPKEDWPKPPSFVGGGLGMKRCEAGAPAYLPRWQVEAHRGAEWFEFERSSSLEQLQVRFDESVKRISRDL